MSRSNIFKMLMIETLENSLSSGIPSTFIISWVSVTAFRQVWYSRVAAWQHFHTGVFDLQAVILAQPRLVRSRNSCKTSTCQTSLDVLPERCVISLMLANVFPGWIFFFGGVACFSLFWYSVEFALVMCKNILMHTYACLTWMQVCVPEQLHLCALIATPSANTHHLRVEQHTYSWGRKTNKVPQ